MTFARMPRSFSGYAWISSSSDLPLNFHPAAISDFCRAGGLDAPMGVISETGGLLPIAPCGRTSLSVDVERRL